MKKKCRVWMVLLLILCFAYNSVSADSGWDTDYDSGSWDSGSDWSSSWDSDSDWDYDSGWSSSSSNGNSFSNTSLKDFFHFLIAFLAFYFFISFINSIVQNSKNKAVKNVEKLNVPWSAVLNKELNDFQLKEIDPSLNLVDFKNKAFNIYKDIQIAWMNFDMDTIRNLSTDEIYNMYSSQLELLKIKGQKNIMKDITLIDVKVVNANKQNNIISINVYLKVSCYDYVIVEDTGVTVRGRDNEKIVIEYEITFVKHLSDNKADKCPSCGAEIADNSSGVCLYCRNILTKNSSDYVMSKKRCIRQHFIRR